MTNAEPRLRCLKPGRVVWLQCGYDDDDIIDAKSPSVKGRNQPIEQHNLKRLSNRARGDTCSWLPPAALFSRHLAGF